jgi:two-component system phosphate regulon response regulator PhoB
MKNILIVEDNEHIREMVQYILEKESFEVSAVASAEAALSFCQQTLPNLIVLDIELPGINGYQFCEELQKQQNIMPTIIMLTDQNDVSDIEKGLSHFADDYIAKPFNPRILVARIKANLRRGNKRELTSTPSSQITCAGITIDCDSRCVSIDTQEIKLQKMEFDILYLLLSSPDKVFSRDDIITFSKGDNYYITDRAIDNQIYKLRKKLGDKGKFIETVSGIGYKLNPLT